jgi:hypothetical protein
MISNEEGASVGFSQVFFLYIICLLFIWNVFIQICILILILYFTTSQLYKTPNILRS